MLVSHSVRTWFKTGCELVFSSLVALVLGLQEVPRISLHDSVRFALTLLFIVPIVHFLFDMYIAQLRKFGAYFQSEEHLSRAYTSTVVE